MSVWVQVLALGSGFCVNVRVSECVGVIKGGSVNVDVYFVWVWYCRM